MRVQSQRYQNPRRTWSTKASTHYFWRPTKDGHNKNEPTKDGHNKNETSYSSRSNNRVLTRLAAKNPRTFWVLVAREVGRMTSASTKYGSFKRAGYGRHSVSRRAQNNNTKDIYDNGVGITKSTRDRIRGHHFGLAKMMHEKCSFSKIRLTLMLARLLSASHLTHYTWGGIQV